MYTIYGEDLFRPKFDKEVNDVKKKINTVLSVLFAVFMCFISVACGGTTQSKGDNKNDDPPPSEKTIAVNNTKDSIKTLSSAEGGWVGTGTYKYTSDKNTADKTGSAAIDKRGSKVKVTIDNNTTYVDLRTGYVYESTKNGYAGKQAFAAGTVGYAVYFLESQLKNVNVDTEIDEDKLVYAADGKTLSYMLDAKEEANSLLTPLYDAYNKKQSIKELIAAYVDQAAGKPGIFDKQYEVFKDYVKGSAFKNLTMDDFLDLLESDGVLKKAEVLAQIKEQLKVDDELMQIITSRKLGEFIAGAYGYVKDFLGGIIGAQPIDDQTPPSGPMPGIGDISAMISGFIDAAFKSEIGQAEIDRSIQELLDLLDVALEFKVDKLIDKINGYGVLPADILTMITENVKFEKLESMLSIKLNADGKIDSIKLDGLAQHSYTASGGDTLLADNNYRLTLELAITEYNTTVEQFPALGFAADAASGQNVNAIIYALDGKDVSVYYETAGKSIGVEGVKLYYGVDETEFEDSAKRAVKFVAETSSFVFDGATIKALCKDAKSGYKLYARVQAKLGGSSIASEIKIELTYMNDNGDEVKDYAKALGKKYAPQIIALIQSLVGSRMPTPSAE